MLLSRSCIYGLRATLYVASLQTKEYVPIREISTELGISFHFLTKILQTLTHDGIMISFRGPNGGVAFGKPPEAVSLMDIVRAIDGGALFTECILGLPACGFRKPCPLHAEWGEAREKIRDMLERTSMAELAVRVRDRQLRVNDADIVRTAKPQQN